MAIDPDNRPGTSSWQDVGANRTASSLHRRTVQKKVSAPPKQEPASVYFWVPDGAPEDNGRRTDWDIVYIMGQPLPGIAHVSAQRHQKVMDRPPSGGDGSSPVSLGTEPAAISIRLEMWTPEQLDEWAQWVPKLEATPGKPKPQAFAISHPALALHSITKVWIKTVGLLQEGHAHALREVTLQVYEWQPVKPRPPVDIAHSAAAEQAKVAQGMQARSPSQTENHP